MLNSSVTADLGMLTLSLVGLLTIVIAVSNWWFEDLPFNGEGEQIATSYPFEGEHIRKAGLWVFIMSEIMVFATFFSSYLRMRTEWCTDWAIRDGVEACKDVPEGTVVTASDLLRYDFATSTSWCNQYFCSDHFILYDCLGIEDCTQHELEKPKQA